MKRKTLSLTAIKPYKNNNKNHSDKHVEEAKKSILEFGYLSNIGVDKNNVIVYGQRRYMALCSINEDDPKEFAKIEVDFLDHLTPRQTKRFRIMDNKIVDNNYNYDAILAEVEGHYKNAIPDAEKIIEDFGLSNKDIDKIMNIKRPKQPRYQLVISCKSRKDQRTKANKLKKIGIDCRISAS